MPSGTRVLQTVHLHVWNGLKQVMLPTPSTSHINPDIIYEPAEDSFLLLDTLSSTTESSFLAQRFHSTKDHPSPSPLILEVGTGSGVVLAFLTANAQEIFGRTDILTIGTDINPYACQATQQTVLKACRTNSTTSQGNAACSAAVAFLAALNTDLATSIRHKMVDVLIFNPPYVPTSEVPEFVIDRFDFEGTHHENDDNIDATAKGAQFAKNSHLISLSYAGGTDGMQVTNRLLTELPNIVDNIRGVAYILLCKQNKPDEVIERVRQWGLGWSATIVGRSGKTGGWEKLEIMRICRVQNIDY